VLNIFIKASMKVDGCVRGVSEMSSSHDNSQASGDRGEDGTTSGGEHSTQQQQQQQQQPAQQEQQQASSGSDGTAR